MRKLSIVLVTALFAVACADDPGVIRIGVAGPHTGDLAPFGIPTVRAAELVVEQINAQGGVLGRQVELLIEDEQCSPEQATNVASNLVANEVVAVLGHICSGATEAAMSIYLNDNILAISPSATNPALTQSGQFPNFFRSIAPDDAQARLQADFVIDQLGASSVAVIHHRESYGRGLAEFAQTFLEEEGVEVAIFEGIDPAAVDYSAVISQIDNSDVDVVVFGGYHPEASKFVDQMRSRGMEQVFLSGDGINGPDFIDLAGDASQGVYATGPIDTSGNPLAQRAIAAHREQYGEDPGAFFLNGYAAMQALFAAIEEAGSTDYEAVRAALQSITVETALGQISFDSQGDTIGVGFAVSQVRDGSFQEL